MKKVLGFVFLCLVLISNAKAEIFIENNGVRYTCVPVNQPAVDNCKSIVDVFKRSLNVCIEMYHGFEEEIAFCVKSSYPQFKIGVQNEPACIYRGLGACNDICLKNYNGFEQKNSYCSDLCR